MARERPAGPAIEHAYRTGRPTVQLSVTDRRDRADSTTVKVNVTPVDTTPPEMVTVAAGEPHRVNIVFSEPVDKASAEAVSNYAIDQDEVLSASLEPDLVTVNLRTSPLAKGTDYRLTVDHVRDRARTPHAIASDSRQEFQYSGMYGWWKLDDGQGGVAADSSGNGHPGALLGHHGGPTWVQCERGMALRFDGSDAYVDTGTHLPNLQMPFSISLWVKPAATQVEHADILGNHGEPYVGISLQQEGTNTNLFGFGYGDGQRWQGTGPTQLKTDEWQHVAVVCDGEASILYVDGVEKAGAPARVLSLPTPAKTSSWARDTIVVDTSTAS